MNAKEEIQSLLKDRELTLKCALLRWEKGFVGNNTTHFNLYVGHQEKVLEAWFKSLDFDYDSDFVGQELYGTLWFTNGTWATRGEYDGSEWWNHQELPTIPDELYLPFHIGNKE